ncbi:c-type cytochrome [Marimonas sp. MJW-29]|uniref:C-type cytochrome n=1 Tax=Sulfitobacter sediminis TaxID=3234186 RepID=A0ABV3RJ79_9RHOB
MSKSLNYLIPTVGGIALVGGLAVASMHRNSGESEIASLKQRIDQVEGHASAAAEKAAAEAARAAELQAQIAEVQAAAETRMASADLTAPAPQRDGRFGLGREAHPEEIAAWDVDVLPDGRGLPEGSGNVFDGEEVFAEKCASCHGDFAEGVDNWPVLAGGFDTLARKDPVKTVGSYWPYLSTVWDYVHRSMPFGEAGTLTADETYAITAYILYSNSLVDDDFELSHENFAEFEMYNVDGFVIDDRPELEYAEWRAEPCMENCKEEVEVTMRSVFIVDTPPEGGSVSHMNTATVEGLPTFTSAGPSFIPEAATKPAVQETEEAQATPASQPAEEAGGDAALVDAGEKVFRKCKSCHQIGAGAKNRSGPQLNGVMGRQMAAVEDFKYSNVFNTAGEEGRVWDEDSMAAFLANPKEYMNGTKMGFAGLKSDEDIEAVIAYLRAATE